jgi:hypothetical protein
MIHQVDRELIERLVEENQMHSRFHMIYNEEGTAYLNLPAGTIRRKPLDAISSDLTSEKLSAICGNIDYVSDNYLIEIGLLYEFRELIDRIEEIWKDYLTK